MHNRLRRDLQVAANSCEFSLAHRVLLHRALAALGGPVTEHRPEGIVINTVVVDEIPKTVIPLEGIPPRMTLASEYRSPVCCNDVNGNVMTEP